MNRQPSLPSSVRYVQGPTIAIASGEYFDFENPGACQVTIEDIAHALSKLCRFTGHCREFYSVAQHSVIVSRIVPPLDAMAGLLHDAAEAFIGDVAKPLKEMLHDLAAIEARIERAILPKFGVQLPIPLSVKHADRVLLRTEQRDLMRRCANDKWPSVEDVDPIPERISPVGPEQAYVMFMSRWHQLEFHQSA